MDNLQEDNSKQSSLINKMTSDEGGHKINDSVDASLDQSDDSIQV